MVVGAGLRGLRGDGRALRRGMGWGWRELEEPSNALGRGRSGLERAGGRKLFDLSIETGDWNRSGSTLCE